jgi:hypothetical protein
MARSPPMSTMEWVTRDMQLLCTRQVLYTIMIPSGRPSFLDGTDPPAPASRALCLPPRPWSICLLTVGDLDLFVLASSSMSMSIHWGATSRWEHVATICFMRFRCMLHIFHLDVAKVDLVLHILQWLYTYVASIWFKCLVCFKHMLQVFYLDVAYVALAIHIYCKCMFQMF